MVYSLFGGRQIALWQIRTKKLGVANSILVTFYLIIDGNVLFVN